MHALPGAAVPVNTDDRGPRPFSLKRDGDQDSQASFRGGIDLDLFLLFNPKANSCIAAGDRSIELTSVAVGSYYLVVDGYQGSSGPFNLQITCRSLPEHRNFWPLTMQP